MLVLWLFSCYAPQKRSELILVCSHDDLVCHCPHLILLRSNSWIKQPIPNGWKSENRLNVKWAVSSFERDVLLLRRKSQSLHFLFVFSLNSYLSEQSFVSSAKMCLFVGGLKDVGYLHSLYWCQSGGVEWGSFGMLVGLLDWIWMR